MLKESNALNFSFLVMYFIRLQFFSGTQPLMCKVFIFDVFTSNMKSRFDRNKINFEKAGKMLDCIWTEEEEGGLSCHGKMSPNKMMFWRSGTKIIV